MPENQKNSLNINPDHALFQGQIFGLVVSFYQNERPPAGLCGVMDWHFHGAISKCIQDGAITGKIGECIYLPIIRNSTTFHIILVGAGNSDAFGDRGPLPLETLQNLQKNLISLKIPKMGISQADFGQTQPDYFFKNFKGVSLWVTP